MFKNADGESVQIYSIYIRKYTGTVYKKLFGSKWCRNDSADTMIKRLH